MIIESPYAGNIIQRWLNVRYARRCMADSLRRGEAPFLSHLLYTQVLNDRKPDERKTGIDAGLEWGQAAELTAVYVDRGVTPGMIVRMYEAKLQGRKVEHRSLRGLELAKAWNEEEAPDAHSEGKAPR